MGLFNKIVNYMTGGSAHVDVDINNANLKSPFPVQITAKITDDNLNMDSVYLIIRCQDARLDGYSEEETVTDNERILKELNEWVFDTNFETRIEVSGPSELVAGEQYEWEVQVNLMEAEKVSFDSEGRKVIWEVQAGIDVPGNDPDSGWVEFIVS